MSLPPILVEWDGEAFIPRDRFRKKLDAELTVHEVYRLEIAEERSRRSHSHFFAAVHDAWLNVPEDQAERWPTSEHLRKWALIQAGYRDERTIVFSTKADAQKGATAVLDEYAVVVVRDAVVVIYTAKSQSTRAMGKKVFQASKDAVLEVVAKLIGTTAEGLKDNAKKKAA